MANVGTKVVVDARGFDGLVSAAQTRSITLKGVRAGIKVLVPRAKAGAPVRKGSGALKRAQGYKAARGRRGKTIAYAVQGARTAVQKQVKTPFGTITAKPSKYDHLVQGGTKPHKIAGRSGGWTWDHPGARPNPYRRRAFESAKDEIGRAVNAAMGAELQKVIARESSRVRV